MTKAVLCCVSLLALLIAAPAFGAPAAKVDCATRMQKLDASEAEGAERLAEKHEVIGHCAKQYGRDKTIESLVKECAKYEEQPVVKQQAVAECQLAAYNYANVLRSLKADYRR